ncbi:MAG: hypothetical protein IKF18_04735 [Erysipelotrichaceae bacterium]|jgi:hypothetical protein|nr:hypothetical protein [Erysipelotrichaceae bacterium]MCR5300606.1 hypothetical protein [Erysipelotrichaceae bacterium]
MKNLAELAKKNRDQQNRDSRRKVILTIVLTLIIILTAVAIVAGVVYFKKNEPAPANYQPTATTEPSASNEPVDPDSEITVLYLQSGNYIAGTDIPCGTYDVEVIRGNGWMSSDNEDEWVSTTIGLSEEYGYTSTFQNMLLEDGDTFTINGPILKLTSDDASKEELPGREPWSDQGYELSSGNYRVGRDFEEGTYDIFYKSGEGYFETDSEVEGGCSNSFGTESEWDTLVFYHCYLPNGAKIQINNLTVEIYPSGLVPVDYYTPIEP